MMFTEFFRDMTPGPYSFKQQPAYAVGTKDRHIAMVSCFVAFSKDLRENEANAALVAIADLLPRAMDALDNASDYMGDLCGEWDWKKNERAGNAEEFAELVSKRDAIRALLTEARKRLGIEES